MRALTYDGPYRVKVRSKPEPRIEHPQDGIVRVTSAAICGSDLHLLHGFIPDTRIGFTFGHEFTGVVEELGPDATAGDAVRRAITASTLRLLGHEAGVRTRREPEDVHQARVATRRLRSGPPFAAARLPPSRTEGAGDCRRHSPGQAHRAGRRDYRTRPATPACVSTNAAGSYLVQVTASDGNLFSSQTFTVTVQANTAPQIAAKPAVKPQAAPKVAQNDAPPSAHIVAPAADPADRAVRCRTDPHGLAPPAGDAERMFVRRAPRPDQNSCGLSKG